MKKGGEERILIIKTSAIGDIVRTFPAVSAVRREFPGARIDYLVGREYAGLLADCPHVSEVIPYDKRRNFEDVAGFLRFLASIRGRKYTVALNLQDDGRCEMIARASGAARRTRIVNITRPMDGVEGVFEILKTTGINTAERDYEFWTSEEDERFAAEFAEANGLSGGEPVIGLNPGVAWPSRRWPLEHFATLADRAREELGARALIFGGPGEIDRAESIAAAMSAPPVIAAGKTTLLQAGALMRRCAAFVSNDSGLMHISAMCRVPTVGLFGPSTPDIARPSGPGHKALYLALPCAPCYKHDCPKSTTECMSGIAPDAVFKELEQIIRINKRSS